MVVEEIAKAAMIQSSALAQTRRKGIGVKVWLVVTESGQAHPEELEKYSVMHRTRLPARDLRALDPMLSYPSSIFGRDSAIVINLEHIKAIITATEVLMINSSNPLFVQFVKDLQSRINCSLPQDSMSYEMDADMEHLLGPPDLQAKSKSLNGIGDTSDIERKKGSSNNMENPPVVAAPKLLPFEFRALEVCLESACKCLESETKALEEQAYPALDELTSTLNLERVRQIKSRLVELSGRVQKVRDELEHLLDDENDMAEMYLTQKLTGRTLDRASTIEEETFEEDDQRDEESDSEHSYSFNDPKPDVEELEMLIEAYFARINGIVQKLSHDFINIMLDDKQNQLLQMAIILNTANMIINGGIVVVGLFGMNINIKLFDSGPINFWGTTFGTIGGCMALYFTAVGWGKRRFLLPS